MHALARLIRRRQVEDPSLTYQRIADKSEAFSRGAVGKWANDSAERLAVIPEPSSIMGLARALDVPPMTVLIAAAGAAGIDLSSPADGRFIHQLPQDVSRLSEDEQAAVLGMIELLLRPKRTSETS